MQELKELYDQWTGFVEVREAARLKAMNPEGAQDLRNRITEAKSELLKAKARLAKLQAELVLLDDGQAYVKSHFDHEWSVKKAELKGRVEALIAEQIQAGVSIPKIMKGLNSKNPSWFYAVRDNMDMFRSVAKEDVAQSNWEWSDATSVHRYALAVGPDSADYSFVLLKGAKDTEFEGEQCIFDFETGYFISGNRAVYESVTESVRKQRSQMLQSILMGTYTKSVKRENNPYFDTTN